MNTNFLIAPSDPGWTTFLNNRLDATIFHHPAWSQLLSETYGYRPFVAVSTSVNGTISAGVPIMEVNSPVTGRRFVSLPFSDYCYPLYDDLPALRQLSDNILSWSNSQKISSIELRSIYLDHPDLYVFSEHVIHRARLEPDVEKVFRRVHEMHRRNIKIAKNNEIQIVRGETIAQVRDFYQLHLRTRRTQGVPVQPWKFFENIKKILFDQGLGFVLLAYKNQECIAGAVFLHWQKTLTYKFGASSAESLRYRPNNLLMWTAMQWGCENDFNCLDLGRSSLENTGLRTFKSRWGAQETALEYTHLAPIQKQGKQNGVTSLMETVLQHSPLWVCRLSGELLYKHFG